MLKSTKSSEPNTYCWHPTVNMPYTFINELYKRPFYNKEMYFSRFSKSQFMPNRRGDKTFVVDSKYKNTGFLWYPVNWIFDTY